MTNLATGDEGGVEAPRLEESIKRQQRYQLFDAKLERVEGQATFRALVQREVNVSEPFQQKGSGDRCLQILILLTRERSLHHLLQFLFSFPLILARHGHYSQATYQLSFFFFFIFGFGLAFRR